MWKRVAIPGVPEHLYPILYTVSVLGRDKGYTIKYSPLPERTPIGESSPNTDSIAFIRIIMITIHLSH